VVRRVRFVAGARDVVGRPAGLLRVTSVVVRRIRGRGVRSDDLRDDVRRARQGLPDRRRAPSARPEGGHREQQNAQQGDGEAAEAAHYAS
jgi:hypothetical protein